MKRRTQLLLSAVCFAALLFAATAAPDSLESGGAIVAPAAAEGGAVPSAVPLPPQAGSEAKSAEYSRPPFWAAFVASFFIILCSEIGDKTFFIAAIMSMKHSHVTVWLGAVAALWGMTVLSVVMGFALPNLLPRKYTHYASLALFAFFGVQLLKEAISMTGDEESEELQEVEAELSKKDDPALPSGGSRSTHERHTSGDLEATDKDQPSPAASSRSNVNEMGSLPHGSSKESTGSKKGSALKQLAFAAVFWQACTLTFVAEWGDRSQIATIALAAAKDPWGVCLGGCIGHAICTGVAVIGGKMLASSISERAVHYAGGILFLIFAVVGLFFDI